MSKLYNIIMAEFTYSQVDPELNHIETIDQEIERLNDETHNLIVDLKNSEKDTGVYDIKKHLLPVSDLYSNNMTTVIDNNSRVLVIPYQVRPSTNGKKIVQYILGRRSEKHHYQTPDELYEDGDGIHRYLDFYMFHHQSQYMRNRFAFPALWANYSVDILFYHYGISPDTSRCEISGYLKRGNDYYIFYDMSKSWINHHYLNIDDPFWLVNIDEIVSKKTVCDMSISPTVQVLFNENTFLRSLLTKDEEQMPICKTVYTYEEYRNMDFTMTFGTQRTGDSDDEYFSYFVNFEDCRNALFESTIFQENDKNVNKFVIMRHVINYENIQLVDSPEYPFTEDEKPWNSQTLFIDRAKPMVYIWNHGLQTPVTCHNVLSSDKLYPCFPTNKDTRSLTV